jgi:multidrug efflux pump subunit AcrA (membrane-fusion protein)
VTVGTSESGTVTLDQVTVSFPVDVTIDSVLVKPGYEVKSGQALVKLNQNSITDSTTDSINKLAAAKISLEQALADQTNKLNAAKLTYQTSQANADYASTEQALTKEQIQNDITSAKASLADKQASLTKYQALQSSFPTDYAKLTELKKWRDDAKTQLTSFQTQLTTYQSDHKAVLDKLSALKSAKDTAGANWTYAKANPSGADVNGDEEGIYTDAKDAYNEYYDYIKTTAQGQEDLQSKISLYSAEADNYSSTYDDYNTTFTQKYGATATADQLASTVASLQSDVATAKFNLEKAQKSSTNSLNQASQKLQSSLNDGYGAQTTYNLTTEQLSQSVKTQQSTYDSLKRQLDDVQSAINGDGSITAPCDGVIVSVAYTAGSSVKASQTIVTIAKPSAVSLAVSLSEEDIADVKIGQAAEITLTAYEGQTFDATVESIAVSPSRTGSASVTYIVTAKMNAENTAQVYTGMSGEVTLIKKEKKDVLYVTDQAITFENGVSSVLVKSADGTQKKTTVTTGFSNGRYVEILSGLKEGDTVLVESTVAK